MPAWSYLLLSNRGEIYLGATTDLHERLRSHNSSRNTGWTKGRRWHLLGIRAFETRKEAFSYEAELKKKPHKKIIWKLQCIERAVVLVARHQYEFNPEAWPSMHRPAYAKRALESAL
jgi:predicted GIY-YIG superfamily endonuclease